jgi:hypothetical protein
VIVKDPHVQALLYEFIPDPPGPYNDFSSTPAEHFQLSGYECELKALVLRAEPVEHFADSESARLTLDPELQAWAVRIEVEQPLRVRFRFQHAEVIDRDPSAEHEKIVAVGGISTVLLNVPLSVNLSRSHLRYPLPPATGFVPTPTVEATLGYLREWRERRSRLLVAAYLIYTRLIRDFDQMESGGKGRELRSCAALQIDPIIVRTPGKLTARNDSIHGRKESTVPQPLTAKEVAWVQAVLPLLIIRAGEAAAPTRVGASLKRLTMANLPQL